MAYLFNSVDDDAPKQNIFAPQSGTVQGGKPADDNIQKGSTSTSTDSGAPSGSGQTPEPTAAPATKNTSGYNPAAASSAYRSAAAGIAAPKAGLDRAQGAVSSGNQALQDKSNAYQAKASQTAKGYELDDSTLSGAVSGDDAAFQKTSARLSNKSPGLFESFSGLGSDEPNVDHIKDAGNLYREEVGPNYSAGQSRLDASMLRQNPEFLARQQNILGQQKSLKDANAKALTDQTEQAQGMLAKNYGDSTEAIRGKLGGYSNDIVSAAKKQSMDEDARRAKLDPYLLGKAHQDEIKAQIQNDLGAADPKSDQYLSAKFLKDDYDLGQYANIDKTTDWHEFLNEDGTGRYNRAQGLLGNADMLQAGHGPGEDYSFDQASAYKNIMSQLRGKREAESRQELQNIEDAKLFGENMKNIQMPDLSWQDMFGNGQAPAPAPAGISEAEMMDQKYGKNWQNIMQ